MTSETITIGASGATVPEGRSASERTGRSSRHYALGAWTVGLGYPFLFGAIRAFDNHPFASAGLLPLALAVPVIGFLAARFFFAVRHPSVFQLRSRWLALATVASPPTYVWLWVTLGLLGIEVPVTAVWTAIWLCGGFWVLAGKQVLPVTGSPPSHSRLGVVHGISACLLLSFIGFHLFNHLAAAAGPGAHASIMELGRRVYRAPGIEVPLIGLFAFQIMSGLRLLGRAVSSTAGPWRVVQLASGAYLAAFLLAHMNSVFVYARLVENIETDWSFASGAPQGLLNGPMQLIPHYALGAFLAGAHLSCGLRQVLLGHGCRASVANGLSGVMIAGSALLATSITLVLCGVRLA